MGIGPTADTDHFGDVNEMVVDALAAVKAGRAGFLDDLFEVAIVGVAEDFGEVAAGPEFVSGRVDSADALEGGFVVG